MRQRSYCRSYIKIICLAGWMLSIFWLPGHALAEELQEYQVKAAFLFNFGKFIDWPEESLQGDFRICVFGQDPFGEILENTLAGKNLKNRSIQLNRIQNIQAAARCQILFLGATEQARISEILKSIKEGGVLTVGETEDFNKKGGMIQFILKENKVRFSINSSASEKGKLKISSQLLKLATNP